MVKLVLKLTTPSGPTLDFYGEGDPDAVLYALSLWYGHRPDAVAPSPQIEQSVVPVTPKVVAPEPVVEVAAAETIVLRAPQEFPLVNGRQVASIEEACSLIGVTRRTVYNWLSKNVLETCQLAGGQTRVFVDSLYRAKPEDGAEGPLPTCKRHSWERLAERQYTCRQCNLEAKGGTLDTLIYQYRHRKDQPKMALVSNQ